MTHRVYQNATVETTVDTHRNAERVVYNDEGVYVTTDDATYTYPIESIKQIDMDMGEADVPLSRASAAHVTWATGTGEPFRQEVDHATVMDDGWLRVLFDMGEWTLADYPPHTYVRIQWQPNE